MSQKVLVAGTGISGISAAKLLLAQGGEVVLYDGNEKLSEEKLSGLTELQVSVAKIVESAAQSADEVIAISGISYAEAAEVLMDLELADIIKLMPDGKYHLK